MGIKNFNKFLRDKCEEVYEKIHLSTYAYKKVAIDISLYLYKYKAIYGDRWLSAFISLVSSLRRNDLHCVFIFDGKAPIEKELERSKRKDSKAKLEENINNLEMALEEYYKTGIVDDILIKLCKNSKSSPPRRLLSSSNNNIDIKFVEYKIKQKKQQIIDISPNDFVKVKELFEIMGVPYYTAPWEAEKMCSKLCIDGLVDAVLSEDTDVLAYGACNFLTKIDINEDTCVCLKYENVLESLGLSSSQFLDLCIMCGTDYNSNIFRVGSHTSYSNILKFGSIENISVNTNYDISILNHIRVRELFSVFENYNIDNIAYCGFPDFCKLEKFISKNRIILDIESLKSSFVSELIFE